VTAEKIEDMKTAVLVPCYQEEKTIGKVVSDFKRELPGATIYVYDNNSKDQTAKRAQEAGAVVLREKRQGKGYVVASMFEQIEADIYVMVDGDDTYDATCVHQLIEPLLANEADMTSATRVNVYKERSFRRFHLLGNRSVCWIINRIFNSSLEDIFSGYRAFTREVVKGIPITAIGYDVETEMTLQALYRGFIVREIEAPYGIRPEGSFSKLNTFRDGFKVISRLLLMIKSYKPLTFFGTLGLIFILIGGWLGYQPLREYFRYHQITSLPGFILAIACILLAVYSISLGTILHSMNFRLLEVEKVMRKQVH
jgi:glycosyltransferase involved in cell wall biosynthesis